MIKSFLKAGHSLRLMP